MATWVPDSGLTWQQYLQANVVTRDIRTEIAEQGSAISARIARHSEQMVGTVGQLESTFLQGAEAIATAVDRLGIQFEYSLGLVLDELQVQSQYLEAIVLQLDSIKKTLQSPLLTQARELFNIGRDRLAKGLLDKALEALLDAEKKNNTDFFIQYYLGKVYLYGIDEDDDVVDLFEARRHLLAAARYGRAESTSNSKFNSLAAEALFHGSIACLALAGDEEDLTAKLEEASSLIHEAIRLAPDLSEAWFQAAKYRALQGKPEKAIELLEAAIKRDPRYAAKALADEAFSRIRSELEDLLGRLRRTKMAESELALREAGEMIDRSEKYQFWSEEEGRRSHQLATSNLAHAQAAHLTGTLFGFIAAIEFAHQALDGASTSVRVRKHAEGEQRAAEQRRREAEERERRLSRGKMYAWVGLAFGIAGFPFVFVSPLAIYFGVVARRNLPPRTSYVDNDRDRAGWAIGLGVFGSFIGSFILIMFLRFWLGNLIGSHQPSGSPQPPASQQASESSRSVAPQVSEDPRDLRAFLEARYDVTIVPTGVVLKPRAEHGGVRTIEVTGDTVGINGEQVSEGILRAWLGAQAVPILRLSRLPLAERQAVFSLRRF